MSDFQMVQGFEEVWRPPVGGGRRTPRTILSPRPGGVRNDVRARLSRVVRRAPEVMVKVTGRTRDPGHLRAHLEYISRNGQLEMEGREGDLVMGRSEVREVSDDWSFIALSDRRRRATTPFSLSVVLSMPADSDPVRVRDAARAFAAEVFADRFDYVFALHTDAGHPHVHVAVRSLGDRGERLNPKKADLEAWRQVFAQALRDRGIEAEATPRRARGVTRKREQTAVRKIRERHEAGRGPMGRTQRDALQTAARAAFGGEAASTAWERAMLHRQTQIRALYARQAQLLARSPSGADRELAARVERFILEMPVPDSRRLALARELRGANRSLGNGRSDEGRDRGR